MASQLAKLDLLLNSIEENCTPICRQDCIAFRIECLRLIKHKLPPIALQGLDIAQAFAAESLPLPAVTDMLEKCWHELDSTFRGKDLDDAEVSGIRALICVLDSEKNPEETDVVNSLSFFMGLINNVEVHLDEEEVLLQKYFAGCS